MMNIERFDPSSCCGAATELQPLRDPMFFLSAAAAMLVVIYSKDEAASVFVIVSTVFKLLTICFVYSFSIHLHTCSR